VTISVKEDRANVHLENHVAGPTGSGGRDVRHLAQNLQAHISHVSKKKGRIQYPQEIEPPIGEHQGLAVWPVKKVLRWHALASSVRVSALEGMLRLYGP
jgi:hypothetical protein